MEFLIYLEHDAGPVRAHAEPLQRERQRRRSTPPSLAILAAEVPGVGIRLGRRKLRDRDRVVVSPTDAQALTGDHHARRILAALSHDVGERPDRHRLAVPPAGLPAN